MRNKSLYVCLGTCLGLSFAWIGGCGDPNPRGVVIVAGSGGAAAGTGGAGSGGAAAGTGGNPGASGGTGGVAAGSGGAAPGSGGAAGNPGTGGAALATGGATAAGGAGAAGGGAGRQAMGSGGAAGDAGPSMIDDFEDGDGRISMTVGRQGPWHSFNDSNGGNQTPSVNGAFTPEKGGANGSSFAAHTTGSGYQFGGIGFDLNNATDTPGAMQSQAYDASAYRGITFWAKGNGNLRVEFSQKAFVPTSNGGSCNESATACWNVYGSRAAQGTLSLTDWKQVTIPFSTLQRDDGSTSPPFDPAQLMGIAFKHEGSTFDFWIDDVAFY